MATIASGANTSAPFTTTVELNPTFTVSATAVPNIKAGGTSQTAGISVIPQDGFAATVNLTCVDSLANTCKHKPILANASLFKCHCHH